MELELLAKDRESGEGDCHAGYLDAGGWITIQGDEVDADTRANLKNLLPGEGAVRTKPQVLIDVVRAYQAHAIAGQPVPAGDTDFNLMFTQSRHSIFRLETLSTYAAAGEKKALAAFLAGRPFVPTDGDGRWERMVAANRRAGCRMRRVHVVPEPLTPYLRYELTWGYAPNVAAGEDVRLISMPEGAAWPLDVPRSDFWLFDSATLFDMHYGDDATWLGVELVDDPARIVAANQARDAAWHLAIPWREYIAERPDLSALVPAEVLTSAV